MSNVCSPNCLYRVYLIQAETRKQWSDVTITSLKILGSINSITGGNQLNGWCKFDQNLANERIRQATICSQRASNNIIECQRIISSGCAWCKTQK